MAVERLRKLRNEWQNNASLQRHINQAFDLIGFDQAYIENCAEISRSNSNGRKSKQIKDNQWGMMEFDWRAMRLIDSPILQRLRYIKQLGFTYLTYPSAEHSRFSHSLGIGHVVKKFIDAIDKRAAESGSESTAIKYVPIKQLPGLSADNRTRPIAAALRMI